MMKKITLFISLFAITAILVSNLVAQEMTYSNLRDGNGIVVNLSLNTYDITSINYRSETMHEITLSGIFLPNEAGMPNLPTISRFVAVPKGAEVKVSIKSMETETLSNINMAPALEIQAIPEEPVMDYVKNEQVYATNEFYPQNPVQISEITNLRGINTVVLAITPFQYNPITQELIVVNDIKLNIEFIGGSSNYDDPKYRSTWFDPILKNALLNYDVLPEIENKAKNYRNGNGCEYLIVIPNREDFRPYAEQILEFRTKQGIYTKIMSLAEMEVTNTDQLKSFFHNAYNTWDIPPVAVLLMGDHNTNMALGIPAETIFHSTTYGNCITDNQYADVTGNKLPDMVFGRMAAETEAQMNVLVSKFLEYETQPCMEPSYYQNPITALGWQTERWFQICSEAVGGYWRQQGKTPVRINKIYQAPQNTSIWSSNQNTSMVTNYFGPNGTGYIPASPNDLGNWDTGTPAQVVAAINNGAFALQHRDHGSESGWGEPAFKIANINQLTNVGKMTYVFTINCLTGKFNHTSPCFGETFHRYTYQGQNAGCVGFLGPTQVSYSFVNDAYAWGMYDFFENNFLPDWGYNGNGTGYNGNWLPAFGNVSGKYFLYQSNWPYNSGSKIITYQMFTAHSDVFLRLFTEVPQAITATHADVALAGISDFFISANEGTLIALTTEINGNIEILDVAIATGTTQTMTIPTNLPPTTEINIVITGQNFLRYESVVEVIPAEGPYIIATGYEVENGGHLTYISTQDEISVTLKNVGIETTDDLTISIACNDPQLIIDHSTATCEGIQPNETTIVKFIITVANEIPNNKNFTVDVTITEPDKSRSWENPITLKAFAPIFSIEKVLINDIENGNLAAGTLALITTVVTNKGGADAYNIKGKLEIENEYISLACEDKSRESINLEAGKSVSIDFYVVTDPNMPQGYETNLGLLLTADYGISYNEEFKVSNLESNNYCSAGIQNCSDGDKFVSVVLYKTSEPSVLLINNQNTDCANNGYTNFTNLIFPLKPGENYTIKVKRGTENYTHYVKGWFDLNENNIFESNEQLINNITISGVNTEGMQSFTVPATAEPGPHRFRLVIKYNGTPTACGNSSYGQTHDYIFICPELYPRVQNVKAKFTGTHITIKWDAPVEGTPIGYNIYRNGNKLNSTSLNVMNFTEENVTEDIYVYNVTAVYEGNQESFAEMSNIICNFTICEKPLDLNGTPEEKTAILTWSEPEFNDELVGYNIFRNEVKINETLLTSMEYRDEELENGTYIYKVSAVYDNLCMESELTEGVSVTVDYSSINDFETSAFNIYPNPTTGKVRIENGELTINNVELFDIYGRNITPHTPYLSPLGSEYSRAITLDLSHLQSGIYFVKIFYENGISVVKRLVIIK